MGYKLKIYKDGVWVDASSPLRPIKINGNSVLTGNDSTALNLIAGSNISITNSSGNVTISASSSGGVTETRVNELIAAYMSANYENGNTGAY